MDEKCYNCDFYCTATIWDEENQLCNNPKFEDTEDWMDDISAKGTLGCNEACNEYCNKKEDYKKCLKFIKNLLLEDKKTCKKFGIRQADSAKEILQKINEVLNVQTL